MAPFLQYLLSLLFLTLISSSSHAQTSSRPKAIVLPVTKGAYQQYVTTITQRTPRVPVKLVVDLGGQFVWMDCQSNYTSSTYRPARCGSAQCSTANSNPGCSNCSNTPSNPGCSKCSNTPRPGCNNNTCQLSPQNGFTEYTTDGDVSMDVISLRSTDGYNLGASASIPQFIFACSRTFYLDRLASGSKGVAGLGRTKIALPSQLGAAFSFPRKFAICLSSTTDSPGAIFFGNGPYSYYEGSGDVSTQFTYTRLLSNPVGTNGVPRKGEGSFEYFMGVASITIDDKTLPINPSLLSIGKNGFGGTKFSTIASYSELETSIYKVFTESFIKKATAMNITRVASVWPFEVCFSSASIVSTRGGLQAPFINLKLQGNSVWTIYPTNSLVTVSNDAMCLAFVDASTMADQDVDLLPRASILLGGYQLEDNLIQFDLATSRVGFVNMPYTFRARCEYFRSSV